MRLRFIRSRLLFYATAVLVAAVGTFWPTPYSLLMPGTALDLSKIIAVHGHPSPGVHLYMTDVSLFPDAPPFALLHAFAPGVRVEKTDQVRPTNVTGNHYDSLMRDAMTQSQEDAAYVAERAVGLPVGTVSSRVIVAGLAKGSHARLQPGDEITSIAGTRIDTQPSLQAVLDRMHPGTRVRVAFIRDGRRGTLDVPTIAMAGKARLGVYIGIDERLPKPPVPVKFDVGNIEGSSGGLMFALEIYRALRPDSQIDTRKIAGTGTIDSAGNVGAIAGTEQKLAAARAAGATVFLVPIENYKDIAGERSIHVIPVHTFAEAVKALAIPVASATKPE